ncbi:MAG: type III-A CRISPR-associated protein Csm2 [Terriglobia bacterium]|jgi:CRISPR-associated protein Csm2
MPDIKDAMRDAGLRNTGEIKCRDCGKPFTPREPHHKLCPDCIRKNRPAFSGRTTTFPQGYPNYFDADGVLKPEYVTDLAENIATELGQARPRMTMHQLRAFYGHVKRQENALKNHRPFKEVLVEISKLKPIASERASKEKIPDYFRDFIDRNVDKSKDEDAFLKGFVEHFQAVVAYCAGTIRER